jgi:hypothetical protein
VHYFSSTRKKLFCPGIFICCQHTYSAYDTPGDKIEILDIGFNLAANIFKPHMWRMFISEYLTYS